ncbi:MAG: hypothetical protein HN712_13595 [Gemmatimonadetes bacterium]|jgi:hypothetical protein|nr:hypothetical protein [Gemmatimonadota bacterium]
MYTYRTAQGVWLNDMRNRALPGRQWPDVTLDDRAEADLIASIRLQSASGFDSLTVFGLLTARDWMPQVERTVPAGRRRRVGRILDAAHAAGIKIYYGLGVYSWGFDRIIASDTAIQGTNPHAMCAARPASQRWMRRVVDYVLEGYDFDGFHLEASDQGRCACPDCAPLSNTVYYSRVNAETARYIRACGPDKVLMVNMCGYLPQGQRVPDEEWKDLYDLGAQLDFLIDAGHRSFHVEPTKRRDFIAGLSCAYGTSGGVWVYPPQRWNRSRWFLPCTRRSGAHLAELYADGGRAVEYYMGPSHNPGVEVNIAFGGRKLTAVTRSNDEILGEVLTTLYDPRDDHAATELAAIFHEAEEAYFAHGQPQGEIHLCPLIGRSAGAPIYLRDQMTAAGRRAYGRRLVKLLPRVERLSGRVGDRYRLGRIGRCIQATLADLERLVTS